METSKSKEVKALLKKLQASSAGDFKREFGKIRFSGGSSIIPTATVYEAVLAAEENCREFISKAVETTLGESNAQYAYALIEDALLAHLSDIEGLIQGGAGWPLSHNMIEVAEKRFLTARNTSLRRLKNEKQRFKVVPNPEGAPEIWDWKGAKAYIREQFPAGVPKQYGMKTRVAEMMLAWFQERYGREPNLSQCYTHSKIFFD